MSRAADQGQESDAELAGWVQLAVDFALGLPPR